MKKTARQLVWFYNQHEILKIVLLVFGCDEKYNRVITLVLFVIKFNAKHLFVNFDDGAFWFTS